MPAIFNMAKIAAEYGEKLIRLRIPANLLNYRPTIMGFDLRRLVLAFMVVLLSVLAFRISAMAWVLSISIFAAMILVRRRGNYISDIILQKVRYFASRKEIPRKDLYPHIKTTIVDGITVFEHDSEKFCLIKVSGREVSSLRDRDQVSLYRSLENMMNISGLEMDAYLYWPGNDAEIGAMPFQIIRVVSSNGGNIQNASGLVAETVRIMEMLKTMEFHCEPGNQEMLREFSVNFMGLHLVENYTDRHNPNQAGRPLRRYFRYVSSDRYYSDLCLADATYDLGPSFMEFIRSMNTEFAIRMMIRNFGKENGSTLLRRMVAERKAEARSAGSSFTNSRNRLKLQVEDGSRMIKVLDEEGILPTLVSVTVRIYAKHPAELTDLIGRFQNAMSYLGLEFSFPASPDKIPVNPIGGGTRSISQKNGYLMNTRAVATILPVLTDLSVAARGIEIGYNDLNEQAVYLDLFSGTSHNALVLGETGSGKSFFSKRMVVSCFRSYEKFTAVIFDPLLEYDCPGNVESCKIITLESLVSSMRSNLNGSSSSTLLNSDMCEPDLYIVRPDRSSLAEDSQLQLALLDFIQEIFGTRGGYKMAVLDEFHLLMKNGAVLEKLDSMMRHSRHYHASIVGISQNVTDFTGKWGHSMVFNSANIFVFRTRSISSQDLVALKLDDFDIDRPETLLGGKGHPYSECIYTDGRTARKIRIIDQATDKTKVSGTPLH